MPDVECGKKIVIERFAEADFRRFMGTQYSSTMFFIIIVVGNILFNLTVFKQPDAYVLSLHHSMWDNFLTILRMAVLMCPIFIWLVKKDGLSLPVDTSPETKDTNPYLPYVQAAYPVMLAFLLAANALAETGAPRYLPSFGLRMLPYTIFFLIRDTRIEATLTAFGICLALTAYTSYKAQSWDLFSVCISYGIVSAFTFYDTTRQHRRMFLLLSKLQDTLKVNQQLAVEAQALELRAMIGNVAHDLKTPLTSLLSGIEMMRDVVTSWEKSYTELKHLRTDEVNAKIGESFRQVKSCLVSMSGTNSFMSMTINRCIDYTKASKGYKLVPKLETVSLQAALEMPVQLMRDVQDTIEIQVLPLSAEVCLHVITDKQWLIENLLCLLSNAVKYSHKGCVQVSIDLVPASPTTIHASGDPASKIESGEDQRREGKGEGDLSILRVEVQDTGIGLSDEAQKSLFNPFKQAQRLAGGTGLGLFSLAKRIEALQGQYGVSGRPDGEQGSLFWFTIPFRPDYSLAKYDSLGSPVENPGSSGKEAPVSPSSANVTRAIPPRSSFNVLVVDDAPMIVKMTTMLLQRKGHTVQHAVNGADALEKLLVRAESVDEEPEAGLDGSPRSSAQEMPAPPQFDVVLMDLQMPVLDGIEAIRRLRAAEARGYRGRKKLSNASLPALDLSEREGLIHRQFVIALSANSDADTRQEALSAGADLFIPKPFTYESFVTAVSAQLKLEL